MFYFIRLDKLFQVVYTVALGGVDMWITDAVREQYAVRECKVCTALIANDRRYGRKANKVDRNVCECCTEVDMTQTWQGKWDIWCEACGNPQQFKTRKGATPPFVWTDWTDGKGHSPKSLGDAIGMPK